MLDEMSPFQGLQVDPQLVCEFLATFARFEYALKETGTFCKRGRFDVAEADWDKFSSTVSTELAATDDPRVSEAITYLVSDPPEVQKYINGQAVFQLVPLSAKDDGFKAIQAVKRVRNNLFHGGKHSPHSPPGRDHSLVRYSLVILTVSIT